MATLNQLLIYDLPVIRNLEEFSEKTHLSKEILYKFSNDSDEYYKTYFIPKKNGNKRLIAQPSRGLKSLQSWILRNILDKLHSSPFSFGFETGSGILDNANSHVGANAVLIIDLKDFFHSIKINHVYSIFRTIGYNELISSVLAKICTYNNKLPQGGPCSPKLANIYCLSLDHRIGNYTSKRGITYTRYADDLSFSASMPQKLNNIVYTIKKIINSERLTINDRKTRLLGPRQCKKITGLVLYDDTVGIGREACKLLRAKIHKMAIKKPNIKEVQHVFGWLAHLENVDNVRHKKMKKYIADLTKKYPASRLDSILM